jgi:hypothetical protein
MRDKSLKKSMRIIFYLFLSFLFFPSLIFSQKRIDSLFNKHLELKAVFARNQKQQFGFYADYNFKKGEQPVFYKSLGENHTDLVNLKINPAQIKELDSVTVEIDGKPIPHISTDYRTIQIKVPTSIKNYSLKVFYKKELITELVVIILPAKQQKIVLVPLQKIKLDLDSITQKLNRKFQAANLTFEVQLQPVFEANTEHKFKNPENSRLKYTAQMTQLRNDYLRKNEKTPTNSLLFFIVPEFEDTLIHGFMVKNKALGFLSQRNKDDFAKIITHEYLYGYINSAYQLDTTVNSRLTNEQWFEINGNSETFSYVDDYEDVVTNNGLIAYYLFEVDNQGNIVIKNNDFLSSIRRPMKKNTYSYHLQITNFLYKTLFSIQGKPFNSVHILSVLLLFIFIPIAFIRFRKKLKTNYKHSRIFRFISRFIEWGLLIAASWVAILIVDMGYFWFEVKEGIITAYHGLSKEHVIDDLMLNQHPKKLEEKKLGSELIIKRDNDYSIQEKKCVLYFNSVVDSSGKIVKLKFVTSSDTLKTALINRPILAESHYMLVRVYDEHGKWKHDELYNHWGNNLTEKLNLQDPPNRILLFINGYRPTSLGKTFEENFKNIQENGVEFPNSLNRIFTNDRYNYWQPWGKIDELLKDRINPTLTYYADGHHSVETSNHRSILKFATLSQQYPQRCSNPKQHTCTTTKTFSFGFFGSNYVNTYRLLPTRPNKSGFRIRENSGRIAGRNLFQLLNELPNTSKNDTLYVIAHSMGFAYAQGIINQMRGNIQFGGFYIIAPENASSGKVDVSEWKEIWQYGSNLGQKKQDPPCLQDGVAPQTAVGGLTNTNRIFIPDSAYTTKGFFDSHFIGYYKWILDILPGKKGSIRRR